MPPSIWSSTLAAFSDSVAATRPAPAGVAAASVAANLGLSLLIKTLAITGGQAELLESARHAAAQLRGAADEDVGAVLEYLRSRDAAAMEGAIAAPLRAARAAVDGLELRAKASGAVKESLAADLDAAGALLAGALRAILVCIDANLEGREQEFAQLRSERESIEARAKRSGVYSL